MKHWWPFAFDRRAHWESFGCSDEDMVNKARLSRLTVGLLVLAFALVWPTGTLTEAVPSVVRCVMAFLNLVTLVLAWAVDTYGTPPPEKDSDPYKVTRTIGPLAFFTKQTLCIQTIYAFVSFLSEAALFVGPRTFNWLLWTHRASTAVAVAAVSLTLLFLRLNWYEATWRRETLDPWLQRGLPIKVIVLVSHLASLPVAFVDVVLVKRPNFDTDTDDVLFSAALLTAYVIFFISITRINFYLNGRRYPYPFMRAFKRTKHWLLFTVVVLAFVLGFVLPLVLAAKAIAFAIITLLASLQPPPSSAGLSSQTTPPR